ncbi:Imm7 family immunity protein [Kribbella sp. NBC_01245]|uniref:Imm7 family immunity protein n=1 Tax=Kribbella sp. NBC_01245 TaxID=2903578 RepID=UPI003FA57749
MYDLHAWFRLAETTTDADVGGLESVVREINRLVSIATGHTLRAEVFPLNGTYYVTITCDANRRRAHESDAIESIIAAIMSGAPGSFGLIYDRDDEAPEAQDANAYRVRVLARGTLSIQPDPFLSPCVPRIED